MPKALPTSREIAAWRPSDLSEAQGCVEAITFLTDHLNSNGQGPNFIIEGPPGTGKSTLVFAFVRALVCPHRHGNPPRHCGACSTCRSFDAQYRDVGIFSTLRLRSEDQPEVHYFPVNCGNVTEAELRSIIEDDRVEFQGRFVIALQEAQFLALRSLYRGLLTTIEDEKLNILWVADTAHPEKLDPMFLRRFTPIATSPPSEQDLAEFLAAKCCEWSIDVAPTTLGELSQRSRGVISECVRVLSRAALRKDRKLDPSIVLNYPFLIPNWP